MAETQADPQPERDAGYMRRALELAARGWGRTWPNPLVGAVVVSDGRVVGEGWHEEYGGAHAEVNALAAAGDAAHGATMYVTLEPCAHWGKTPPCTDAVERAGILRLVYAAEDPSADAGGGGARLRSRGVEVTAGVERAAAREQNRMFFHVKEMRTPFVALKYALSLDARLSAVPGRPTAITGDAARREAHRLRAGYDAIVVGIGTVLADDPLLTVRGDVRPRVPPVRVVFDSDARLPVTSRLVASVAEAPAWCVCAEDAPLARREALASAGVRVLSAPRALSGARTQVHAAPGTGPAPGMGAARAGVDTGAADAAVDTSAALDVLWSEGLRALFVEGGARLGASLLALDRVEELDLFYGALLIGEGGVPAFVGEASRRDGAGGAGAWRLARTVAYGNDVLIELHRARGAPDEPAAAPVGGA